MIIRPFRWYSLEQYYYGKSLIRPARHLPPPIGRWPTVATDRHLADGETPVRPRWTNTTLLAPRTHFNALHLSSRSGDPSPTAMAARWWWITLLRQDKPVKSKWDGQGAPGAYHDPKTMIGWSGRASEAAGHGETPAMALLPTMEKTAARVTLRQWD
jgi:hypothetical protein